MEKINFSDCTLSLLEDKFGLQPAHHLPNLAIWMETNTPLASIYEIIGKQLAEMLRDNVGHWNEQDLSMHFIGPLFAMVNFTSVLRFNLFAQSTITATIQDTILTGRVDELIASGFRTPKIPFFAFNEYKKETNPEGDPAAQALAAMLVGQALNENDKTIYGCYIIGASWRFIILEGKKYAISTIFDGTNIEDTHQILRILFQLKEYCMQRTEPIINF